MHWDASIKINSVKKEMGHGLFPDLREYSIYRVERNFYSFVTAAVKLVWFAFDGFSDYSLLKKEGDNVITISNHQHNIRG